VGWYHTVDSKRTQNTRGTVLYDSWGRGVRTNQFPRTAMLVRESAANSRAIVQLHYYPARGKKSCQKVDFSNELPATWLWLWCHYPGGHHTLRNLTPIMIIEPSAVKDISLAEGYKPHSWVV